MLFASCSLRLLRFCASAQRTTWYEEQEVRKQEERAEMHRKAAMETQGKAICRPMGRDKKINKAKTKVNKEGWFKPRAFCFRNAFGGESCSYLQMTLYACSLPHLGGRRRLHVQKLDCHRSHFVSD